MAYAIQSGHSWCAGNPHARWRVRNEEVTVSGNLALHVLVSLLVTNLYAVLLKVQVCPHLLLFLCPLLLTLFRTIFPFPIQRGFLVNGALWLLMGN